MALETYQLGNNDNTRWMSMSVVKSMTATLIGAAIKEGPNRSTDEMGSPYFTELSGTAYEGVSIRNLLQMASGVKWDETYTNSRSDRRRMPFAEDYVCSLPH